MAPGTADALSTRNILQVMSTSISNNNEPFRNKNPYAAVALLCHASMLAVGFRLVGLGEDHSIEVQSDSPEVVPLPPEWDASSSYAFRYKHSQSSMDYLVKVSRLGSKAIIMGVGLGDDKTAHCEVKVQDYISEGSLNDVSADTPDLEAALQNVFISSGRITDLVSLFRLNIIQKLAPGIAKEGYQESSSSNTANTTTSTSTRNQPIRPEAQPDRDPLRDEQPAPARPYPFNDPLAMPPRRTGPVPDFQPPGFEDEFELQRPRRGMFPDAGLDEPFGRIGERDLYPPGLGPHDPLRIGGMGGGFRSGGGMHPTFDDPVFGGQQWGNDRFEPRAPPGARYDPVGPGDGPPNVRGGPRFPGGGGGRGGPPNPFHGFGGNDFV